MIWVRCRLFLQIFMLNGFQNFIATNTKYFLKFFRTVNYQKSDIQG